MSLEREGGGGEEWACANFSWWHCEAVSETEAITLKSPVIFEQECHHHSPSCFWLFLRLQAIFSNLSQVCQKDPHSSLAN